MEKVFVSPMAYRQGENVLWNHLEDILAFGRKCLIVTDGFVYQMLGARRRNLRMVGRARKTY